MRSGRMRSLLTMASVVALVAVACGDDDAGVPVAAGPSAGDAAFCKGWNDAIVREDDEAFDQVLESPPAGLEEAAAVARAAGMGENPTPEAEAAIDAILNWTELNCRPPGENPRRLAPPIDAVIEGLTFCSTFAWPSVPADDESGVVLYGDLDAEDPYGGPMLGLVWWPDGDGGHAGDGDSEPVDVRGHAGLAAPITVFQQTVLPELGTVIAWTEGGRALGLYGRLWPMDRKDELVAIADAIEETDDGYALPHDRLPAGFGEVFEGDPGVMYFVFPSSAIYVLRYDGEDGGLLTLSGQEMSEDEFNAFRFLTIGVERSEVHGRHVLSGDAWHAQGPRVVTWREPDGLVVRIVGLGVPLASVTAVAEATRELTRDEWAALVESDSGCLDDMP